MTKTINYRLAALTRFATAITILNLFGHFFLGFEQSWAHPLIAIVTTYSLEILFETLYCALNDKTPRFKGGFLNLVHFLLPAHITAMAVSMLLFTNERLMPVVLACGIAILSKIIFRVNIKEKSRHFLNPSNTGIAAILILFPWIGIAPPYQFSENLYGLGDWAVPLLLITAGSFLNAKFTQKIPLILAWLSGFFLQGLFRNLIFGTPILGGLAPMTGIAFLLFTFYMVSDPATTPFKKKNQIYFGFSVAMTYGLLMSCHIVFGLFFSLLIVCTIRGAYFFALDLASKYKKEQPLVFKTSQ